MEVSGFNKHEGARCVLSPGFFSFFSFVGETVVV